MASTAASLFTCSLLLRFACLIFSRNFCSGAVGFLLPAFPSHVLRKLSARLLQNTWAKITCRQLGVNLIMYGLRTHENEEEKQTFHLGHVRWKKQRRNPPPSGTDGGGFSSWFVLGNVLLTYSTLPLSNLS